MARHGTGGYELGEALRAYYARRRPRYEPSTWEGHERRLEDMRRWLLRTFDTPEILVDEVEDEHLLRYFNRQRGYAPGTFNNARVIVSAFWRYCQEEGWVRLNPMRHVDPMKPVARVRLRLNPFELANLIVVCENPRDEIALQVAINTGARSSALRRLTVGKVDLGSDTLYVYEPKVKTEKAKPITSELRVALLGWFQHYARELGVADWRDLPNDWTLIPPCRGQGFGGKGRYQPHETYSQMHRIAQRYLAATGFPTRQEGFHTIRRSVIRETRNVAYASGSTDPLDVAREMAGHRNRATTETYIGEDEAARRLGMLLRGKSFLGRAMDLARAEISAPEDGLDNFEDEDESVA